MLVEVKVKVARIIDGKTRKRTETYLMDSEIFANAEYAVMNSLANEQNLGTVDEFEIQSLRISPIKEICTQYVGEFYKMSVEGVKEMECTYLTPREDGTDSRDNAEGV